jgi:YidC/Oxa1 family membrane protein insertase
MDNLRTFFIFGLLIVSLLLWQAWQQDYAQAPVPVASTASDSSLPAMGSEQADLPELPAASADVHADMAAVAPTSSSQKVRIKTDVMDVTIDTQGGDIRQLALLKYAEDSEHPDVPVQFLNDSPQHFFVTQSGLRSDDNAPTHYDNYTAEASNYFLAAGQNSLQVPLRWQSANGLTITKTYTFHRDSYMVDVDYHVDNHSADSFSAYPYAQFNRTRPDSSKGFVYTYTGAVFSSQGHEYDKINFDDLDDKAFRRDATNGWAAMIQHYFVAALIPPQQDAQSDTFYGKSINKTNYTAGIRFPALKAAAGEQSSSQYQLYLGPKQHQRLASAADKLDLTVDYGYLTILSVPLFKVMEWIHKLTNNWGWSIVFLTVLIKLVFFRLSAASYRSMAAMRKLTPKLSQLKERYGDDKQKFNQEMMKLYRTEKINPLGGCLPILVQMPVFLAFYWVLVESIELRQADFILWIHDLTAMDPYFVLPVLFGISMWFQQKLNPAPQDPAQATMMKVLPLIFTVFFAFFPAGLVLYWVVNNALSIAQQWYITRKLGAL